MTMTDQTGPEPGTETRFDVRDGQRPLTFVGWQIASSDSQTGNDIRWTELTLYRTLRGKYVLEKIGRSDVFHSDRCGRRSKGERYPALREAVEEEDQDKLVELFVPCPDCEPMFDETPVWVERDIFSVAVFESAQTLVDSMHRRENDNMRFLSRVARVLLESAARTDPEIARVLNAPADVT